MVPQKSRTGSFKNIRLMVSTMNDGYARYDVPKNRFVINEFSGFNVTASRANGEMGEMQNLTGDEYPNLYQRAGRAKAALPEGMTNIQKVFRANGKLCYIADGKLWYDGKAVADVPADGEKSVAVCNGKICVMPDKVFYDYVNEKAGYMDEKVTFVRGVNSKYANYTTKDGLCYRAYGSDAIRSVSSFTEIVKEDDIIRIYSANDCSLALEGIVKSVSPEGIYLDTETTTRYLYYASLMYVNDSREKIILGAGITIEFDEDTRKSLSFDVYEMNEWSAETVRKYISFVKQYLFDFELGDTLRIIIDGEVKATSRIAEKKAYTMYNETSSSHIVAKFTLYFEDVLNFTIPDDGLITIERFIPDMHYICEKDNRLFGVCNSDNKIVASKLGYPLDFEYFPGTSLDSYSVDVGSDGEFTGICSYAGDIVLFKERHIHVLSGTKPSLYQLSGIEAFGIEKGSNASLASLDGRLYYKSLRGIMAFEGTYPRCISQRLGNTRYSEAIGADDGRKYYVSMKNPDGKRELFVYDTETALWHREDSSDVVSMCEVGGALNIATKESVFCTSGNSRERVPWSAVFGPFDSCSENKKLVSTLALRYKLSEGARFEIAVSFDGGEYEVLREVFYSAGTVLKCDVRLKRCNEFSLRLSGKGYCRVLGMSMELREGSMK